MQYNGLQWNTMEYNKIQIKIQIQYNMNVHLEGHYYIFHCVMLTSLKECQLLMICKKNKKKMFDDETHVHENEIRSFRMYCISYGPSAFLYSKNHSTKHYSL